MVRFSVNQLFSNKQDAHLLQIKKVINSTTNESKETRSTKGNLKLQCITESSFKRTTLSQKERIYMLRQKIHEEIRSKMNESILIDPLDIEEPSVEVLDHESDEHLPITPIYKKTEKYTPPALTTVKFDSKNGGKTAIDNSQDGGGNKTDQLRSKRIHKKKTRVRKPLEIFYRRIYNKDLFDTQLEWVHCQDIITPFLTGAKLNMSNPKRVGPNDPTVVRLLSLLKVNTSTYAREDIYSILYQISNLNLRFFRWDVPAMKMLFNVIIREKRHSFGSLKHGLRDLFTNWRLDFSNSTALLRQTRIFRPPCVYIATDEGSTKSPKVTLYPKKLEPTTPCDYDDEDCKD